MLVADPANSGIEELYVSANPVFRGGPRASDPAGPADWEGCAGRGAEGVVEVRA